ncbi:hypothetical protein ZWY2020_054085 [Hordeum vulgare]|nr:hypothetical protein ZWY2020_054085 [Hordeum vulgare]
MDAQPGNSGHQQEQLFGRSRRRRPTSIIAPAACPRSCRCLSSTEAMPVAASRSRRSTRPPPDWEAMTGPLLPAGVAVVVEYLGPATGAPPTCAHSARVPVEVDGPRRIVRSARSPPERSGTPTLLDKAKHLDVRPPTFLLRF